MSDQAPPTETGATMPKPELPAAAKRALAQAEARRAAALTAELTNPPTKELDGRDGPEPVRYGDWEKKGLAIDF